MLTAIFKGAPHPDTALLFARWMANIEGQKVMAQGGRTPAHAKVEPVDKTRTEKIYLITVEDLKEFPKYDKIWGNRFSDSVNKSKRRNLKPEGLINHGDTGFAKNRDHGLPVREPARW